MSFKDLFVTEEPGPAAKAPVQPARVAAARIVKTYDLINEDLCWHPDIIVDPRFMQFVAGVKTEFERL